MIISEAGLSPGVLAEVERGLKSHELIKVRVFGADRDAREALLSEICAITGAQPVQHIGKILVVFRENPPQPAPRAETKPRTKPRVPRRFGRRKEASFDQRGKARRSSARGSAPRRQPGRAGGAAHAAKAGHSYLMSRIS